MRILRLVDEDNFAVEFHPYITVVAQTSGERRRVILETFERAATGRTTTLQGLIEVHGVVLDLDERALGLLELDDGDIDISVTPSDLPGSVSSGVGRQVRAAERRLEALEQPHRDRLLILAEAEASLEAASEAEAAARASAEQSSAPVDVESPVNEALEALVERRAELQLERDRLFASLDPGAAQAFDAAIAALDAASVDAASPSSTGTEGPARDPIASDDVDEDRLEDLQAALSLHHLYDPSPVREALDEVRAAHASGETVASTEALSLADHIDALDRQIADLHSDASEPPSSAAVETAADRVEQARIALIECERQLQSGSGGVDDIRLLEEAHADVERARDSLEGRFGRAKAQERLDVAVVAENDLLERLGLGSYTEFLTRGGSAGPTDGSAKAVEIARRAVVAAESEAEALVGTVEDALTQAQLVEDRRTARSQARALLGDRDLDDEEILTELLNVRVPADDAGPRAGLLAVLAAVGLPLDGVDVSDIEVEAMAADWLAEHQHTEVRLTRQIEALESAELPVDAPVIEDPALDLDLEDEALSDLDDLVADAHEAVQVAKQRVVGHEATAAALADVETALAEIEEELRNERDTEAESATEADPGTGADGAIDAVAELAADPDASLSAAAEDVQAARTAVAAAAAAVDEEQDEYDGAVEELAVLRQTVSELAHEPPPVSEIEWYLLARLAAQRQQSFVGSLPLVISGALDGVADDEGLGHLLDRLERMAGAVQIVHITDDPRIIGWADALEDDRAAVVRPVLARA